MSGNEGNTEVDKPAPRRARTLAEFYEVDEAAFPTAECAAAIAGYRPRPTDVVITPYSKCGTTWLQQIFHTLRTRGDMDFDDISRVVPWIETAVTLGLDLDAPQRAEPRGFKSHLSYDEVPKGARYIVAVREPKDAWVSLYRFMEGWFIEPGAISIAEFAQSFIDRHANGGGYWRYLTSWWAQRDNPEVLILSYEHMLAEPGVAIRRVAAFSGIPLDDDLLALTLEQSSFGFMAAHKDRFDEAMTRAVSEARGNLPPNSDASKVRQGTVGGHRSELSAEVAEALDAMWRDVVTPATGFPDYAAFEAAVRLRDS
jgi:hypothetical protein